jgi:hypothetical protein
VLARAREEKGGNSRLFKALKFTSKQKIASSHDAAGIAHRIETCFLSAMPFRAYSRDRAIAR